jgi:hypothetical protein
MTTLSIPFGQRKFIGAVAALFGRPRVEEYRAQAAECQEIAEGWSGLVREQYEQLARQWLILAANAGATDATGGWRHH